MSIAGVSFKTPSIERTFIKFLRFGLGDGRATVTLQSASGCLSGRLGIKPKVAEALSRMLLGINEETERSESQDLDLSGRFSRNVSDFHLIKFVLENAGSIGLDRVSDHAQIVALRNCLPVDTVFNIAEEFERSLVAKMDYLMTGKTREGKATRRLPLNLDVFFTSLTERGVRLSANRKVEIRSIIEERIMKHIRGADRACSADLPSYPIKESAGLSVRFYSSVKSVGEEDGGKSKLEVTFKFFKEEPKTTVAIATNKQLDNFLARNHTGKYQYDDEAGVLAVVGEMTKEDKESILSCSSSENDKKEIKMLFYRSRTKAKKVVIQSDDAQGSGRSTRPSDVIFTMTLAYNPNQKEAFVPDGDPDHEEASAVPIFSPAALGSLGLG